MNIDSNPNTEKELEMKQEIKKENLKNMELQINEIFNYINSLQPTLKSLFISKLKNKFNFVKNS